jgi:hypothetical protein
MLDFLTLAAVAYLIYARIFIDGKPPLKKPESGPPAPEPESDPK